MIKNSYVDLEKIYDIIERYDYKYGKYLISIRLGHYKAAIKSLLDYTYDKVVAIAVLNDNLSKFKRIKVIS